MTRSEALRVLGVSAKANWNEIESARKHLLAHFHPDRFPAAERLSASMGYYDVEAAYALLRRLRDTPELRNAPPRRAPPAAAAKAPPRSVPPRSGGRPVLPAVGPGEIELFKDELLEEWRGFKRVFKYFALVIAAMILVYRLAVAPAIGSFNLALSERAGEFLRFLWRP